MIDNNEYTALYNEESQWSNDEWDEEISHPMDDDQLQFVGDMLQEEKSEGVTRLYFQNLNGLKWDKDGGTWPSICQAMASIHADVMGFAEVNQDTSKYEVRKVLDKVADKQFAHKKLITGTSNRKVRKTFKPGGTMMMTVNESVSLVRETCRDRMGQWVATRYQGQTHLKVTIIMAYQVCQKTRTGHNTAANQQINMILEESVQANLQDRPNPRQVFIEDLTRFITGRQREGIGSWSWVILMRQ